MCGKVYGVCVVMCVCRCVCVWCRCVCVVCVVQGGGGKCVWKAGGCGSVVCVGEVCVCKMWWWWSAGCGSVWWCVGWVAGVCGQGVVGYSVVGQAVEAKV